MAVQYFKNRIVESHATVSLHKQHTISWDNPFSNTIYQILIRLYMQWESTTLCNGRQYDKHFTIGNVTRDYVRVLSTNPFLYYVNIYCNRHWERGWDASYLKAIWVSGDIRGGGIQGAI